MIFTKNDRSDHDLVRDHLLGNVNIFDPCESCHGTGKVLSRSHDPFRPTVTGVPCSECNGTCRAEWSRNLISEHITDVLKSLTLQDYHTMLRNGKITVSQYHRLTGIQPRSSRSRTTVV